MLRAALLTTGLLATSLCHSVDIFKTDAHFTSKNYKLAYQGYVDATERGNPHAHYQLAQMYFKGLGVEKDLLNAILHYAYAAEYDFHNSQNVLNSILASLPAESQEKVSKVISQFITTQGKATIDAKYFPKVLEQYLSQQLTFGEGEELQTKFYADDYDIEDYLISETSSADFDDEESTGDELLAIITPPKPPFLIVDHDIHTDGSVRHYREVQKLGGNFDGARDLLEGLTLFPLAPPSLDGQPVEFASRAYMGAAVHDKFTLVNDYEEIYRGVIMRVKKLKAENTLNARYEYASAMVNFPWLEENEGDAERIYLELANLGHSPAMFEYGLLLYRQQKDLDEAIRWIGEAAKYGLIRAEYRIGKILQSSPWVEQDEQKALYWFKSAAKKGVNMAKIRATDIMLTSSDPNLIDLPTAKSYLSELESSESQNPEYFYLLARSLMLEQKKDFKTIFEHLRKAISLGQLTNWDVGEWEDLLNTMMQGNITISSEGNCADDPSLCEN